MLQEDEFSSTSVVNNEVYSNITNNNNISDCEPEEWLHLLGVDVHLYDSEKILVQ